MNNSQPKIVYNEDCVDLREHFEKDMNFESTTNLKEGTKEWSFKPKTKHERNEVVNTALKKLAKSYNTNNVPFEKKMTKPRLKDNLLYDSYRKKFSESQDAVSLKSKSELVDPIKYNSINSKQNKVVFPSSPTIKSSYAKGDNPNIIEPFKNKFTMTKKKPQDKDDNYREGKNLVRDKSIEKSINSSIPAKPSPLNYCTAPVWKDQRLTEKYSLLKVPWKRSYTLPVFSEPSMLVKEEYKNKIVDNSDKKTYLYDDGSEIDSTYDEPKRMQYFGFTFQNQLLTILNISAYIIAILVVCLIVWFISENKLFYKLLIPKPPESPAKKFIKLVGGSVIYALTSVIRLIGRIFAIPTQQIYHPATEYAWPPIQ